MKQPAPRYILLPLAVAAALLLGVALLHIPFLSTFAALGLVGVFFLFFAWLVFRAYQGFLWRVGRRLAFSYFLVGALPIPMVLLLLGAGAYLLSGFFLSHLYRDAQRDLQAEVEGAAHGRLEALVQSDGAPPTAATAPTGTPRPGEKPTIAWADYRNGKRVRGDSRAPAAWPSWLAPLAPSEPHAAEPRFFVLPDGTPTIAAARSRNGFGAVAFLTESPSRELSVRSDLWVEVHRPDSPASVVQIGWGERELPVLRDRRSSDPNGARAFFAARSQRTFWDRSLLWWAQVSGPVHDLSTGREVAEHLTVGLTGTPRILFNHLFASTDGVDANAWAVLVVLAFLLFDVYAVAAIMAVVMIVGLSRAVNRLYQATTAVRDGDFSFRIPVRRRDQVGELQRSFNEMSANLETLVAASAQKELLEKELLLARDVQKSLIPSDLPSGQGIDFATLFAPSAAIGGDYFDVLRLSETKLAIIIADVSGHGLSTGLRMAMVKAALLILVEETHEPVEIFHRLHTMLRADRSSRFFVTATLGIIDLQAGTLQLTNAGHPPTYVLRDGHVEEVLLPGSPLGGLGQTYGHDTREILRGDLLVWLSDGLIEAENKAGEPFGYDNIVRALETAAVPGATATSVRDRLLAAIASHVGDVPPADDRTLVVVRVGRRVVAAG